MDDNLVSLGQRKGQGSKRSKCALYRIHVSRRLLTSYHQLYSFAVVQVFSLHHCDLLYLIVRCRRLPTVSLRDPGNPALTKALCTYMRKHVA